MYLCYVDESGVPAIPGNTSHFVLAGLAIPIWHWRTCSRDIRALKSRYDLDDSTEIHTTYLLRNYREQGLVPDFARLSYDERRHAVRRWRNAEILRLQRSRQTNRQVPGTKKVFRNTDSYVHLTFDERRRFVSEFATLIGEWRFARLFAECIDKLHYDPSFARLSVEEQAFEQVVSRFERFLQNVAGAEGRLYGVIVHDNNETVARRHTELMNHFQRRGTFWTSIERIVDTPFFVDSSLTAMVQVADLCSYALRRYLENEERDLFDQIFARADRIGDRTVGVRHFTQRACSCLICSTHRTTEP